MKVFENRDLDENIPSEKSTRDGIVPGWRDPGGARVFGWRDRWISSRSTRSDRRRVRRAAGRGLARVRGIHPRISVEGDIFIGRGKKETPNGEWFSATRS